MRPGPCSSGRRCGNARRRALPSGKQGQRTTERLPAQLDRRLTGKRIGDGTGMRRMSVADKGEKSAAILGELLRRGPPRMATASAASACSGAAAPADGCDSTAVGLGLAVVLAGGFDGGRVLIGASTAGSLELHPASHGTASVGAASPKPMITRRVSWAGWKTGMSTSDSATRRRYLTRAVCCRTRAKRMFPSSGRHNRRT